MKLWLEKTNQIPPESLNDDLLDLGNKFEPVIAEMYAERTGRQIKQYGQYCVAQHETIPYFRATPDRWVTAAPDRMGRGLVQIKKSNRFVRYQWDDGVPLAIQIQTQAEMAVTGYDWDSVPRIYDLVSFETSDVERDPAFILELEDRVRWFWDLVQSRTPPGMDGDKSTLEAIKRLHPHDNGETVRLPEEAVAWADLLANATANVKTAEAAKRKAEAELRSAIGSATFGELPDGRKFSLKTIERIAYTSNVAAATFRTLRQVGGSSLP